MSCTGEALPRVNCDSQRESERGKKRLKKKKKNKPVSLSLSEVKWMCNLLSRETRCKAKAVYVLW